MRLWTTSWRWVALVLLAWAMLLFFMGGHLVRESQHTHETTHTRRELANILTKLERLKQQNHELRRMAQALR